jgi:hypothetical protein
MSNPYFTGGIRRRVAARHDRGNQGQTARLIKRLFGQQTDGYGIRRLVIRGSNPGLVAALAWN